MRGTNTTAIQVNGNASTNESSRGRTTFRHATIAPGIIATDHGNHQTRCIQINRYLGTPLSLPGMFGNELTCPIHSTGTSWRKKPGKCNSVATYQGTNSRTNTSR